jgi:hypothetical protein
MSFKIFESNLEIEKVCRSLKIKKFQIVGGLVNVDGDVDISNRGLSKIPVKFGRVEGYFYCHSNQLTHLEGSPQSVGGNFGCVNNQLTHLEGAPQSVGGYFGCSNNQLTHLEGAPQSVGGDFDCSNNQLTHLEGGPQSVGGNFYCYDNQLTHLEGAPRSVGGNFYCYDNQLTHLEGAPRSVGGDFGCQNNQLTTFRGIPDYSLNEDQEFYCEENPIFEIYKLFNTPKCIDLINEYEVIGDGMISRVRLEEVFVELGLEVPKKFNFQHYKLVG